MASTILDSHSNRNKTPPKFHGFDTFAEPCCPITLTGAFRDNIRRFPLYTVEENVERSDRPFCDYCRCIECEAEYFMEEFGTNPDIDEKPPIPLRDALEKM